MEGIDKHFLIEGIFIISPMSAAIFRGQDYSENLHSVRNTFREPTVQKLFVVTQRCISKQNLEISGVSKFCWSERRGGHQAHEGRCFCVRRLLYCVLERCALFLTDYCGSRAHSSTENRMESMESRWSSSGNIPRTHYAADSQGNPSIHEGTEL